MQTISIILVAALLFLTDPPRVSSRISRDGVNPRTQEKEEVNAKSSEARALSDDRLQEQNESELSRTIHETDDREFEEKIQEAELDQAEYRRMNIEAIKETILQKLKLKSPPQVNLNRRGLPSVLSSNREALPPKSSEVPDKSQPRSANLHIPPIPAKDDDFYGTTKNVFVFPDNSSSSQIQCSGRSAVCLIFRLPPEVSSGIVASSHLWLYKQTIHGVSIVSNQTLVVSELIDDSQRGFYRKSILSLEDGEGERSPGEWLRLRVDRVVQRWVRKPHIVHALEISCIGCGNHSVPVSQAEGQQPFLEVSLKLQPSLNRRRRDVDCTNTTSSCCKESFYLSFKEIGWDDWIIAPEGYFVNNCRGTCPNHVSYSKRRQKSVMNWYLQTQKAKNVKPISCMPSKMKALSVIYIDEDMNLKLGNVADMVVEACDCAWEET